MRPLLLSVVFLACAAHPAAAAGPAVLEATLEGLRVDGSLALAGTLASLGSTGQVEPERSPASVADAGPRTAPTGLRLAARHLRAETDVQRQSGSPAAGAPQGSREEATFDDAVADALPARDRFLFYVAPLPGHAPPTVRLEGEQAQLRPEAAAAGEPMRLVPSSRPALQPPAGPAAQLASGLRTLRVEGDFALTLWEWDLQVASGPLLRSGYSYVPTLPSMEAPSPLGSVDTAGDSEERQLFLYAEGATLELAAPAGAAVALFLHPGVATLDGRLALERPSGHLTTADGDHPLRDGDWVDGAFSATLSDLDAASLRLRLEGTGRAAGLAGLALPIPGAGWSAAPLLALLAVAGVAVLGSWRLVGRRRPAPASPPPASPAPPGSEADEVATLRWLDAMSRQEVVAVLWDSDLMRALDWPAERAQAVLRGLQAKGEVRWKAVALEAGHVSLGRIGLTAAGADRLRDGESPGGGSSRLGRIGLRRLASWLPPPG